jgi:hypothetical protein
VCDFFVIVPTKTARKFSASVPNGEGFDPEMEPVQFLCCRNLSLIVPLYGLEESRLKTELILGVPNFSTHAASNEAYSATVGNF